MLELGWRRAILSPAQLSQRLQLRRGMSVLELGAGSGYYSRHVVEQLRAGRLVLLDLQVEMLSRNRARCDDKSVASVLFIAGDATNVPLVDASVDLVFMVAVFGEIPNQAACLSEIARVLRPLWQPHSYQFSGQIRSNSFQGYPEAFQLPPKLDGVQRAQFHLGKPGQCRPDWLAGPARDLGPF